MSRPSAPIPMVAYRDTWPDARERWWDIGSYRLRGHDGYNQFGDWLSSGVANGRFDYAARAAQVTLTYDRNPNVPHFVGHISAHNLKPNFAYQLKLAGKPVGGPRGMGRSGSYVAVSSKNRRGRPVLHTLFDAGGRPLPVNGDDWTNQQLGYAGRWWNDSHPSRNTNAVSDRVYQSNTRDTLYGYQFLGVIVTDKRGNAEWDIFGNRSYHATWQDWQVSSKDACAGSFNVAGALDAGSPPHFYGYGTLAPAAGEVQRGQNGRPFVKLYYELERRRPNPVVLPRGTYHCRLLITEETFHSQDTARGGHWKTVMATEDFSGGEPDTNDTNDIVFTIE